MIIQPFLASCKQAIYLVSQFDLQDLLLSSIMEAIQLFVAFLSGGNLLAQQILPPRFPSILQGSFYAICSLPSGGNILALPILPPRFTSSLWTKVYVFMGNILPCWLYCTLLYINVFYSIVLYCTIYYTLDVLLACSGLYYLSNINLLISNIHHPYYPPCLSPLISTSWPIAALKCHGKNSH